MFEQFDILRHEIQERHSVLVLALQEIVERAQMAHPHFESGAGTVTLEKGEVLVRQYHPWQRVGKCQVCGHHGGDCTGWGGIS